VELWRTEIPTDSLNLKPLRGKPESWLTELLCSPHFLAGSSLTNGAETHWVFRESQPLASSVIQLPSFEFVREVRNMLSTNGSKFRVWVDPLRHLLMIAPITTTASIEPRKVFILPATVPCFTDISLPPTHCWASRSFTRDEMIKHFKMEIPLSTLQLQPQPFDDEEYQLLLTTTEAYLTQQYLPKTRVIYLPKFCSDEDMTD
jgi:hypothetical protein